LYMYATVDLANSRPLLPRAATGRTALQTAGSNTPHLDVARTGEGPCRAAQATQGTGPVQWTGTFAQQAEQHTGNGEPKRPMATAATGWPGRARQSYRNIRMQLCPSQPSHPPAAQASGPRAGQAATGPDRVTSITGCDSAQSRAAGTTFGRPSARRVSSA
jgi:hypothetical protein